MSDLGTALLFLFVAGSFIGLLYFLARFLIQQGRK